MTRVRVATIDIGTNTVLLLVAERGEDGGIRPVEERATITRLGEGVDKTRTLAPAAIARTTACLDAYAQTIRAHAVDHIAVVGTSAMRDAGGGNEVRAHVARVLGVEARTISGDEEAKLTFSGALSGLVVAEPEVVVFDIGGGSTEIVEGEARGRERSIRFARSLDVGSVRLTERHVRSDPPAESELAAVRADVRAALASIPKLGAPREPIGIAGTMTTLAAISLGMATYDATRVHGMRMTRGELERVYEMLARMPLVDRRVVPGLEPKRADVIVAGAAIVLGILEHMGAEACRVSDRGVRWGLAEELARLSS